MSGGPLDLVLLVCACLGLAAAAVCLAALRRANSLVEHPELNGQASWLRFVPVTSRLLKKIEESSRRRQQAESDNETRYKILTENVPAAVMLHQSDGMVLWGSPFTEVLTGFSLSEVLKNRESFLLGQVHEEDKRLVEKSLAIVKTGEPFQYRYRFYHKSGMTLWLETRTVPIYDSSLNDYIALSITLDVTSAVLNQLQIEERNRDLNEFTYMVSHDLKNPINTIKGMIGILQAERTLVDEHLRAKLRGLLADVRSGAFAKRFMQDHDAGHPEFGAWRRAASRHPIEAPSARVRALMPWLSDA